MNTRPKTFVAVCDFSIGSSIYSAGGIVPPGAALSAALSYGERFVTPQRKRAKADQTDETPTPTPNKEGG